LPSKLAHRSVDSEVFITSISSDAERAFVLGARWPMNHPFYQPDDSGNHDPMLIAETMRQAGIVVAHAGYAVPFDTQFIMGDISFSVTDPRALLIGDREPELVVSVSCSEVARKREMLRRTRFHFALQRSGARFAHGSAFLVCLPATLYESLRRHGSLSERTRPVALPPLDPHTVGRKETTDVLLRDAGEWELGSGSATWNVYVDPAHPSLFDHPLDHLPGMAQLEAFRQAALALAAPSGRARANRLQGCAVQFLRIANLNTVVRCRAETLDAHTVKVELRDADRKLLTKGSVRLG
jgi:hypothetical protein